MTMPAWANLCAWYLDYQDYTQYGSLEGVEKVVVDTHWRFGIPNIYD
jgi:hypothetical protein